MVNKLLFFIILLLLSSCTNKKSTSVSISIKGAAGKKIYLIKVPFTDEKEIILDSATVIDLNHPIHFNITQEEERLFIIKAEASGRKYQFINDNKNIELEINHINGKYNIGGSPASSSLRAFNDNQLLRADTLRQIVARMKQDSVNARQLKGIYDSAYQTYVMNFRIYADTVRSPAAFMAVLDLVDFGSDYEKEKAFFMKAAKRFSEYKAIQQMKTEVLNMVKIYEEEYQVGNEIPSITLPSSTGENFSTASLKGHYYLMDVWSTWCPQCRKYNYYKKRLYEKYAGKNFSIVSISFDDEVETWKHTVARDSLNWTQLIDEKMWRGPAANTLKFDSIPFNFLIDPQGKIIAKAIRADSLLTVVAEYVK